MDKFGSQWGEELTRRTIRKHGKGKTWGQLQWKIRKNKVSNESTYIVLKK